ncbi:MAG: four helix bundle protein [Ginsengibacter sp.]
MKIYSFEKLEAWQHARRLSVWIYKITKDFPPEEKYGLVSQMKRSALGIGSTIAEGTSRMTEKDQSHFSTMAFSSAVELLNHLILCNDLLFITESVYLDGRNLIEKQTFLISQLRKSQQNMKKKV